MWTTRVCTRLIGALFTSGLAACAANTLSSTAGRDGGDFDGTDRPDAVADAARHDVVSVDARLDAAKLDGSVRDARKHDSSDATTRDVAVDTGRDSSVDAIRDARRDTTADASHDASADRQLDSAHDVADAGPMALDASVDAFVCDPSASPHDQACVIDESLGVFVAPPANGGSDTAGDGSRAKPFASINYAVAQVTSLDGGVAVGKRVYACAGTFPGTVVVKQSVQIFGGLVCPQAEDDAGLADAGRDAPSGNDAAGNVGIAWTYSGQLATVVGDSTNVAAMIFVGVPGALVEDFDFEGASSLVSAAVAVLGSHTVSFVRVLARSANGGSQAPSPGESNFCPFFTEFGRPPDGGNPGVGGMCVCPVVTGDESTGGRGGAIGAPGENGSSVPAIDGGTGVGGVDAGLGLGGAGSAAGCTQGHEGANGAPGQGGTPGLPGYFMSGREMLPQAASGDPGRPGQGGGGGGGTATLLGGGGGAGGCGGNGGPGGIAGGGSFAVLVLEGSKATLASVRLLTGAGGAGSPGLTGSAGEGPGGPGRPGDGGCTGGQGGVGGGGGGGGGGAGGDSVGIAFDSTSVVVVEGVAVTAALTLAPPSLFIGGTPGLGGSGGIPPQSGAGIPGLPGQAGPNGRSAAVKAY